MWVEDLLKDNPTMGLGGFLDDIAEDYADAYSAIWGLESREPPEDMWEDEWRRLVELHRLAAKLASGASTLVRPARLREEQLSLPGWLEAEAKEYQAKISNVLEEIKKRFPEEAYWQVYWAVTADHPDDPRTKRQFFENCMELEAYRLYHVSLGKLSKRMLKLVGTMIRAPGEFTRAYLSRVAECYVRGMETELAVMARTVLDLALQETINDSQVLRLVGERRGGRVDLDARIGAALKAGVLEDEHFDAADSIRRAGNLAAHPRLEALTDVPPGYNADALLEDLANVLRRIESEKGKG